MAFHLALFLASVIGAIYLSRSNVKRVFSRRGQLREDQADDAEASEGRLMSDRLWMMASVVPLALLAWIVSAWFGLIPGQTPPIGIVFLISGISGLALAITLHRRGGTRASQACFVAGSALLAVSAILRLADR